LVPKKSFNDTIVDYQQLSLLAVPSISMETGPLTLLEALALGVPVYGSNRIGQLHLLREHGRIVEPNTPDGWRSALADAFTQWTMDDGRWTMEDSSRRRAVLPLRTMADVAKETLGHYRKLTEPRLAARS
jgi:glycosyltransferase involved in cell wall biosynthesis